MTLQEYEKQLLEKRKALDSLKKEERKVTLDKDFESMQLLGRKKEDLLLNNLVSNSILCVCSDYFPCYSLFNTPLSFFPLIILLLFIVCLEF